MFKDQVECIGSTKCRVSLNGKSCHSRCYVSKHEVNLTGLDWIRPLKLTKFYSKTVKVAKYKNLDQQPISKNPTAIQESFGQCTKLRMSPMLKPVPEKFQKRKVLFLLPLLQLWGSVTNINRRRCFRLVKNLFDGPKRKGQGNRFMWISTTQSRTGHIWPSLMLIRSGEKLFISD